MMGRVLLLPALAGFATMVGACVGDDPGAAPGPATQLDGGSGASSDGGDVNPVEPSPDGGNEAGTTEPKVTGRVVGHRGLPLAQATVILTDSAGKKSTFTTDAKGTFSATLAGSYDAVVQRAGSITRHVYLGLSSTKPTFRTLGEFAVTDSTASASLTLNPALAAGSAAQVVGGSEIASVGTITFGSPTTVKYQALPGTTTFPMSLGVLVAPSAGGRPTAFGQAVLTADTSGDGLFTTTVSLTAIPATGGGAAATTLARPNGFKVAARALKMELADKAVAIAQTSTGDDPSTSFGDFSTLGIAGVKYSVEALAAVDSFAISGRGRFLTRPLTFGRRGGRAENALNIALELAAPPTLTAPTSGAAGFPRKGPVAFAPATATTFQQVHAVRVHPKAAGSNSPGFIVYTGGAPAIVLPDDGLAPSTSYIAEVLAFGPYPTLDALVEAPSPLPIELLEMAGLFAEASRVRVTDDGSDASFAITSTAEFTTGQ